MERWLRITIFILRSLILFIFLDVLQAEQASAVVRPNVLYLRMYHFWLSHIIAGVMTEFLVFSYIPTEKYS